jgi:hypothetical protein
VCLVDESRNDSISMCPNLGLTVGVRKGVVESTVHDSGRALLRWHAIVLVERFWCLDLCMLNSLDYAVDTLMPILLRGSVLLMLLQIRATAHVRSKAWAIRLGGSIDVGHIYFGFGRTRSRWYARNDVFVTELRLMVGLLPPAKSKSLDVETDRQGFTSCSGKSQPPHYSNLYPQITSLHHL